MDNKTEFARQQYYTDFTVKYILFLLRAIDLPNRVIMQKEESMVIEHV